MSIEEIFIYEEDGNNEKKRYQKKLRQQTINIKDERKVQLRNRAGTVVVSVLAGAAVVQYIAASIVYKYLCRKM